MLNGSKRKAISYGCIILAITLGLYCCSLFNYPLFHSLVEIITIAIGFTLFILAWNSRRFLANDCLKFVGVGYAFIAVIDLLHTLAYKGMNVFPGNNANLPTQFWIAARFLQALTLCVAPVFARRRIREHFLFGAYFAAVSMIAALIFTGNFPDCYVEGTGLTPFKVVGEYTICTMLVVSLFLFHRVRASFNARVNILIVSSIVLTVISELSFTEYLSVYGFANMLGHLMKLAAFYLIYRALLVTGLKEPFDLIFRDLKQKREALRDAYANLEEKVVERTAELAASEEKYRALIECANDAIFIHEITEDEKPGPFIEVNELACRLLGYSREELSRMSPMELDDPRYRYRIELAMERLLREGHAVFETAQIAKDGRSIPVEVSTRLLDLGGKQLLFSLVRDITERKRAEEKLFQVTEMWARTFDALPDLIAIIDTKFRIVQANKALADRLGLTPQECIGKVCYEIIHESVAPPSFCPHTMTLNDYREHTVDVHVASFGGDFIVMTSPVYSTVGELIGSVHVARDITERKRAETEINNQLHFLQQLLDSIPIPVYYKDTGGVYLGCNAAFETLLGMPRSDIVGKKVYDVLGKERADLHHEADLALLRHPGVQVYEVRGRFNDGKTRDVIFNKATFVDVDNRVAGIVCASIDITSLRKAEEERKLLEDQLHQSQKMEAIGQLAGGIAHDFNNMLTAIMGYAEIMLRRIEEGSPLRHFIEQVLTVTDSAAELTNGLLTFSRRRVLHAKPVDLCGVVRGFEKMVGRLLPEDVDFRTTFTAGNLIVMADRGQIEQVLVNLVNNARDAMPRGGRLVIEVSRAVMHEKFVHAHGIGEPGDYACLAVTDTGHGMDEEARKRAFEPFFSTKDVGKGTGLGLAIVYGIIQQHNGCIIVSSETGKGTTFRIFLPLIGEEIMEAHVTPESVALPGGSETILLVEDEEAVRESYGMILEEAGYRVLEATDGEDALDRFLEHGAEADMVITDVIMPKIDGKTLGDEMRKTRPDMKVLFMSGYAKEILVEKGILVEGSDFVTKPVKPFELLNKVREMLDRG